ncbi:hypothetical protein GQ43DRAFT_440874 [Delitschia confertaspora ATCC 74209]|uniref:Glycosyltransferase family 69 protein n=1 Tax=Delitschia confertaspora ATCC 74209 TaxID=1513339 RepID=A0A9P4MVG8_9PLEO|nr:hypothetical protein GQ43DRAFT_440874 [Delitschia confertaspora ATCC 74209]
MSPRFGRPYNYALLPRSSIEDKAHVYGEIPLDGRSSKPWFRILSQTLPSVINIRLKHFFKSPTSSSHSTPRRRRRCFPRIILWVSFVFVYVLVLLVVLEATFLPSYTYRPSHYNELRKSALNTTSPGRANLHNEKVFIAASIYDQNGTLTSGPWADAVLSLVDLLGPDNVFLSVYENNPDPVSKQSLADLKQRVHCNSSINDETLSLNDLPHITLPSGEKRLKRIAFLAEVRNRALLPLEKADITFDKLLFVNDVIFDPIEAAQLLFSTNVDSTGRANYGAACAVDFINPFKFYDRFATRDLDGYSLGIPFYPWFTDAGSGASRQDVLDGKDAVRVRSCWGGMTAFEAKWFQPQPHHTPGRVLNTTTSVPNPLRFRSEQETFWDSSECCLINADLQYRRSGVGMPEDSGIYMNPFVRVAYDPQTLRWLSLSRRPERLYSLIHNVLSHMVGFPMFNPRRTEEPGETIVDKKWEFGLPVSTNLYNVSRFGSAGSYPESERVATPGGFCGGRKLLLINESPAEGEGKWVNMPIPLPIPSPLS